jgi:hypothetical protein
VKGKPTAVSPLLAGGAQHRRKDPSGARAIALFLLKNREIFAGGALVGAGLEMMGFAVNEGVALVAVGGYQGRAAT